MTYDIEIVLRNEEEAAVERAVHEREPREWTEADVREVLKTILRAVDRVRNPDGPARPVALRGFSWIVEPFDAGRVVIAIEIPTGAAVAGPFAIEQAALDDLVRRAVAQGSEGTGAPQLH